VRTILGNLLTFRLAAPKSSSLDSECKAEAILRVHLEALILAVTIDAVDRDLIENFGQRWMKRALKQAPVRARLAIWLGIPSLSFSELYRWFKDSMRSSDRFKSKRLATSRMVSRAPWSFQTNQALAHWFDPDLVPQIRRHRLSETDARRIADAFERGLGLRSSAHVGRPGAPLWLTFELATTETVSGSARQLRDVLGLFDRPGSEYGFLVQLAPSMGALGPVYAPTALDACGYARFRPWPKSGSLNDTDAGRTYDLDPTRRLGSGGQHGRPEMIHVPRALAECVALRGVGYIEVDADDSTDGHIAFANEVSPGTNVQILLERLSKI
jgi:hypothetical protein